MAGRRKSAIFVGVLSTVSRCNQPGAASRFKDASATRCCWRRTPLALIAQSRLLRVCKKTSRSIPSLGTDLRVMKRAQRAISTPGNRVGMNLQWAVFLLFSVAHAAKIGRPTCAVLFRQSQSPYNFFYLAVSVV